MNTLAGCRRRILLTGLTGVMLLSLVSTSSAQLLRRRDRGTVTPSLPSGSVTAKEAAETGVDAYIYGYPLVTMEMTRRVMTNVEKPEGTRAPMGQLVRMRTYPDASFPRRDGTQCRHALYDGMDGCGEGAVGAVSARCPGPLLPDADARWLDRCIPGSRQADDGHWPQKYAITGPGWKGTLPAGVTEYKSPTALVWLLGRIYCTGTPEDYEAVHKMQDEVSIVPLSSYGKPYTPPAGTVDPKIDMKTPVREQVNSLDATAYFNLLATLMKDNPPAATDAFILAKMARLGIEPGKPFDPSKLDPAVAALTTCRNWASRRLWAISRRRGRLRTAGYFDPDGDLRHRLRPACIDHRYRLGSQSAPGRRLSNLRGRRRRQALRR